MSDLKNKIIDKIIEAEGGYVNDPSDSGGETNYGITKRVARKNGYTGRMIDLPRSKAFTIYSDKYWDELQLDNIEEISPLIAEELADTGVNAGTNRSAEFLQRCLNVLNQKGSAYSDIAVDGDIGPATITALNSYFRYRKTRAEGVLYKMLNSLQGAFYIKLAERREKDERFIFGWFENRVD